MEGIQYSCIVQRLLREDWLAQKPDHLAPDARWAVLFCGGEDGDDRWISASRGATAAITDAESFRRSVDVGYFIFHEIR